jgi:hypothetical protein
MGGGVNGHFRGPPGATAVTCSIRRAPRAPRAPAPRGAPGARRRRLDGRAPGARGTCTVLSTILVLLDLLHARDSSET